MINPATAIGRYHRDVLRDGSNWAHILREISLLIGLGEVSATAGTAADPWTVAIAGEGSAQLQLAAWHQPAAADATVEQLRLGLRLAATPGGATVALVSEVLTFDLPASGPAHVAFLGAQEFQFVLHPAVDAQLGAAALSLDTLDATAGWSPGGSLGWQISAQGLTVSVDGESVTAAELHLPPAQPFDFTDLNSAAAALGLSLADLTGLIRMVLVLLADQAGPAASLGAALLGLHAHLPGMSEDTPPLIDPADPGLLLRDPLAALRDWLGRLTAHTGTSGQASLIALLRPLGTLGTDLLSQLSGAVSAEVTDLEGNILGDAELALADLLGGAGSFGDPWRIAWPGAPTGPAAGTAGTAGNQDALAQDATGPELELWLEPAGPPSGWLSGLATRAQQASAPEDLAAVLRETAWFDPQLRSLLRGLDTADLLQRLISLEVHLGAGDGVVPRDSQAPDVFGWVPSIEVDAAHHLLPSHPDVISEVLTRIEQLRAGGPRTVLLIGPDFTDHTGVGRAAGRTGAAGHHRPGRADRPARPRDRPADDIAGRADHRRRLLHRRSGRRGRRLPGRAASAHRRPARPAPPGADRRRRPLDGRAGRAAVRRRSSGPGGGPDHAGHAAPGRSAAVPQRPGARRRGPAGGGARAPAAGLAAGRCPGPPGAGR